MKKIKNQFGRSMLEMLGVLAVIAVLSVGTITGFRYAMDAHHINNLMHDISLLGMAVATRDHSAYNADCEKYEEDGFTIPSEFVECKATYGQDELVVLTVTYNDEMPERIIQRIENRCTQDVYVSAGATQFTIGPHGWNCQLAATEGETGPEDPSEWECSVSDDCYHDEECSNHKCQGCPNPDIAGPETLSEACCRKIETLWNYPFAYTNGKCVWNEDAVPDETKCAEHQKMYDSESGGCTVCISSNQVADAQEDSVYCCGKNESKSACCAAVGKYWCEKIGVCVANASACNASCGAHEVFTDLTTPPGCDCPWGMMVYDSASDEPVKAICCDWSHDSYSGCCEAAGGYWSGDSSWDWYGTCLTERQTAEEEGTCIKMLDWQDFRGIVNVSPGFS